MEIDQENSLSHLLYSRLNLGTQICDKSIYISVLFFLINLSPKIIFCSEKYWETFLKLLSSYPKVQFCCLHQCPLAFPVVWSSIVIQCTQIWGQKDLWSNSHCVLFARWTCPCWYFLFLTPFSMSHSYKLFSSSLGKPRPCSRAASSDAAHVYSELTLSAPWISPPHSPLEHYLFHYSVLFSSQYTLLSKEPSKWVLLSILLAYLSTNNSLPPTHLYNEGHCPLVEF